MASSSSPSPVTCRWLGTPPRPPAAAQAIRTTTSSFSPLLLRRHPNPGCAASRVSSGIRRSPEILASVPMLVGPTRCSNGDPGEVDAAHVENTEKLAIRSSGPGQCDGKDSAKGFSTNELLQKLKRYGLAGVLSYGLLNTVYYLTTFLLVWFYFAPAPGRMGYGAAVERFLKVMAMVWAGSQVTKIIRAGGALALAPFVDSALRWFTMKFKFQSEGKAFAAIAGFCFALALLLFFGLTLLWA